MQMTGNERGDRNTVLRLDGQMHGYRHLYESSKQGQHCLLGCIYQSQWKKHPSITVTSEQNQDLSSYYPCNTRHNLSVLTVQLLLHMFSYPTSELVCVQRDVQRVS